MNGSTGSTADDDRTRTEGQDVARNRNRSRDRERGRTYEHEHERERGDGHGREGTRSDGRDVVLRTTDLRKRHGETVALDGVSLEIERGEFFALLGPSGCGKTTLLRLVAGLETPTAGEVGIDGRSVTALPASRRDTHIVFQDLALFPHMTVAENVAYGLRRAGVGRPEREQRVSEALDLIGLPESGDRDPAALSGGQRQRVALARSLVTEPAVLLLDEPLSSLDRRLRQDLQVELQRIQSEVGTTFLYVTHNQDSAMSVADRIAVMREGRIAETGAPETLYERPRTEFVARFLGDANVLAGEVIAAGTGGTSNVSEATKAIGSSQSDGTERARGADGSSDAVDTGDTGGADDADDIDGDETDSTDDTVRLALLGTEVMAATNGLGSSVGDRVSAVVRPEAVTLGSGPLTGRVLSASYKGFYDEYEVRLDSGTVLRARTDGDGPRSSAGEETALSIDRATIVEGDAHAGDEPGTDAEGSERPADGGDAGSAIDRAEGRDPKAESGFDGG